MPLTPQQIDAAGPWAVLAAVLIAGFVALVGLIVKRVLVPGWIFDRSEDDRAKSDTQAERNADAIAAILTTQADLAESFKVMARSYERLDVRLEAIERGGVKHE